MVYEEQNIFYNETNNVSRTCTWTKKEKSVEASIHKYIQI